MSKVLPDPKAPKESADYVYGKRMEEYEDRQNFFLNEKVEVKKDEVEEEDKETVDGLEALVSRFTSYQTVKVPQLPVEYDGTEGVAKKTIDFIVQMAKDLVDFILNLINNKIARVNLHLNKAEIARKNSGLKTDAVQYPFTIRRLLTPLNPSVDANWVGSSIDDLKEWYKTVMIAHKTINDIVDSDISRISNPVEHVVEEISKSLGLKDHSGTLQSAVLPSNRRFSIEINTEAPRDFKMYFVNNDAIAKLKSETFIPTGFLMDNTIKKVRTAIKEIQSNQSTVSQLYRKFEKKVRQLENEKESLTQAERSFYSWVIQFDRRLLSSNLQYVMQGLESGIDFVNAGVK